MKTIILLLLPVIMFGQSASVTLEVKLASILSISVDRNNVSLDVNSPEKYTEGVQSTISNHLTTFSTGPFLVKVKALDTVLESGSMSLPLNTITISGFSNSPGITYSPVVLSLPAETIIDSSLARGKWHHDITYKLSAGLWQYSPGNYSTTIHYEIMAK